MPKRPLLSLFAAALAILALAVPGTAATPKPGTWKGTKVELGQDLKFKVSKNGKRIHSITANVLENCSGSTMSTWTVFAPDSSWKVKPDGRFSGRKKEKYGDLTAYFTFKGRFTSKGKAKGILRQETIVAAATCDTYELDWKAKRVR